MILKPLAGTSYMFSNKDQTNRILTERYGRCNTGQPNFRLVWSENQTENRFGEFEVHTPQGIWLRNEKCVRTVPKYPYVKERWILEKYVYAPAPEEVKDYNFYEPVFVFESAAGQYLEPVWPAIEALIHSLFYPTREKLSDSQMRDQYDSLQNKIADRDVQMLENERPDSVVLSELGEQVYVPRNFEVTNGSSTDKSNRKGRLFRNRS